MVVDGRQRDAGSRHRDQRVRSGAAAGRRRRASATQWGIDPVHAGAATLDAADPIALRTARGDATSTSPSPEAPGVPLSVAGHAVGFDEARELWYCDLQVDTGPTWMPFVRLALARYQPSSARRLELSPIVLADFVQLAADRTATITPGIKPRLFNVQLERTRVPGDAERSPGARATVTVQQRIQGLTGPLAWESVGNPIKLTRQVLAGPTVAYSAPVTIAAKVLGAGARVLFEEIRGRP